MTEKQLQQLIIDACRALGLLVYHTYDSRRSEPGFPDLVIVGNRVIFRELKTGLRYPTRAQKRWLLKLLEAGADAQIWKPDDWESGEIARTLARLAGKELVS